MKIGKKIESFERFNYVDADKTIHSTKSVQRYMLHCPVTRKFCRAICTIKSRFVSEWVTRAYTSFFINEISKLGATMIIQVFHLFIQETA